VKSHDIFIRYCLSQSTAHAKRVRHSEVFDRGPAETRPGPGRPRVVDMVNSTGATQRRADSSPLSTGMSKNVLQNVRKAPHRVGECSVLVRRGLATNGSQRGSIRSRELRHLT
jgi:hypothetical protein